MSRRAARVTALQVLYQVDLAGNDPEEAFTLHLENFTLPGRSVPFARDLVRGTVDNLSAIDAVIRERSKDWDLERLSRVDRSILRLALFEIMFRQDIPVSVSINEALELARSFSGEEAVKFINGILGGFAEDKKKAEEPAGVTGE